MPYGKGGFGIIDLLVILLIIQFFIYGNLPRNTSVLPIVTFLLNKHKYMRGFVVRWGHEVIRQPRTHRQITFLPPFPGLQKAVILAPCVADGANQSTTGARV